MSSRRGRGGRRILPPLPPAAVCLLLLGGVAGLAFEAVNPGLLLPGLTGGGLLLAGLAGGAGTPRIAPGLLGQILGAILLLASRRHPGKGLAPAGATLLAAGTLAIAGSGDPLAVRHPAGILVAVAGTVLFLLHPAGSPLRVRKSLREGGMPAPGTGGIAATTLSAGEPGRVLIDGERFAAVSRRPAPPGTAIRVIGSRGGLLRVAPVEKE